MLISLFVTAAALAGTPQDGPAPQGSIHAAHAEAGLKPRRAAAPTLPPPAPFGGPDVWVYGYLPYWVDGVDDVPWDHVTHVAFFDVGVSSDGSLTSTSRWTSIANELVTAAHGEGVKVHLTVTCFDDAVMDAVLPSATLRAKLVQNLKNLVDGYDADGVSVDFEGMGASNRDGLVSLVSELSAAVGEVTVATPAVDWNGAYDYDALAYASDALFIMGYDYHWSGGDPGPVAPLYGGDPWSKYSIAWTLDDYFLYGGPPERIILGLPLYGKVWPTTNNDVPGSATAEADSITLADAVGDAATYGRLYESLTETPYYFPSSRSQAWYDDEQSIRAKVRYAVDQGLLGVGFWALGYEGGDPGFWAMMAEETTLGDPGGDGDSGDPGEEGGLRARAGQDFMAYVGQTVILNGRAQGAADPSFAWTQASGPGVTLSGADTAQPSFSAQVSGTFTFELVVGDGAERSAPDTVSVVVTQAEGGLCGLGSGAGGGLVAVVGLALTLSRRRAPQV
jgi:GH18 family chitinase